MHTNKQTNKQKECTQVKRTRNTHTRQQKRKISRKILLISIIIVVAVGFFVYVAYAQQNKDNTKPRKPITYSGPTEQDKKDAEDENSPASTRENIESSNTNSTSASKKQVTPIITNASQSGQQVTINSYVSGIFEDGGTCVMKAAKGNNSFSRSVSAFADATTTSCSPLFIESSSFSEKGDWTITISYSSKTAEGTSATKTVTIK